MVKISLSLNEAKNIFVASQHRGFSLEFQLYMFRGATTEVKLGAMFSLWVPILVVYLSN